MDLSNHVALVTGGGRGIGEAIALSLAAEGTAVAVTARTKEEIDRVVARVRELGSPAFAIPGDVTDSDSVARVVEAVTAELGPVDILINNAGAAASHKFLGHPDGLWHRMLAVNLTGTYLVTKAVVPGMVDRRWGRIVNIASIASKAGGRYVAAYTAAKHGVLGLTRALAAEFVHANITVNAVCPGYVDTPMTDAAIENIVRRTGMSAEQARHSLEATTPQNRLFQPEEVAAVVMLLVGENARGITGQAINVDGGALMF